MLFRHNIQDVYGNNFSQAPFMVDEIVIDIVSQKRERTSLKTIDKNGNQSAKTEETYEVSDDSIIEVSGLKYWGNDNLKNQNFKPFTLTKKVASEGVEVEYEEITDFSIEFDDQVQQQFESVQGTMTQRANHVVRWFVINRIIPTLKG